MQALEVHGPMCCHKGDGLAELDFLVGLLLTACESDPTKSSQASQDLDLGGG